MSRAFIAIFFMFCAGAAFAGPALTLTLPDNDRYSYWIQSRNGFVSALPRNVSHQASVTVRAPLETGDHLILLDASTGQWAEQSVTLGADGRPTPIAFALGDFHPLTAPAQAAVPLPAANPETGSSHWLTLLGSLAFLSAVGGWLWYRFKHAKPQTISAVKEGDPGMILMPGHHGPASMSAETGRAGTLGDADFQRGPEIPLAKPATLMGVQGLATGSTFALTAGDITIGRDGENEIVLAENTVSRYHARLLRQDNGQFALTDLGSANGVYVNGTRVQRAILHSGDQIKVGDNFFQFQMNDETRKKEH